MASKSQFRTAFLAAVVVPLAAAANVRWSSQRIRLRWVSDAEDPYTDASDASVGAIATDSEPNNDAVFVLMKSAKRGRFAQGSKHFGGTSEIDTTDNILVGAGLARWQAVQAALALTIIDAGPNTWVPTILSRTYSVLNVNPTTVLTSDVVSTSLNKRIGSMSKRKSLSSY